jgi:hypothetical protein
VLCLVGLLNLPLVHVGSWWIEPWREEYGLGAKSRPMSARGAGLYGEEAYVILSIRWGVHRPWEYPPPPPRKLGYPVALYVRTWANFGITTDPPPIKMRADFSRRYALDSQAAAGHGFHRAGLIVAMQPGWTSDGRWRNVGLAIHGGWLAFIASFPLLLWVLRRVRARRRFAVGLCPTCGYDLRATPERCPECGRAPARQ